MKTFKKMIVFLVIISILMTVVALVSAASGGVPGKPGETFAPLALETTAAPVCVDYAITTIEFITPSFHAGNIQASDMPTFSSLYIAGADLQNDGNVDSWITYPLGSGWLKIMIGKNADGKYFVKEWQSSGITVRFFCMKGSNDYFQYDYDGTVTTDKNLWTPRTQPTNCNSPISGISHIIVFYKETTETSEATTTTTTTQATTTTAATTTTEATTTTTATTTTEATTTETSATIPSEATVTNPTTTLMTFPSNSIPLVSVTTATTTGANTTLTNPNIPQTGEGDSGNGLLIGLILLALAGALTVVVYRSKSVKA